MLTDTHTHLYLEEFAPDNKAAVQRAIDSGVQRMIFPNVDLCTIKPMEKLAAEFPDNICMAMGFHPTEVNADYKQALAVTQSKLIDNPGHYVAVGEIGMDLYWDKTFRTEQMQALEAQIDLALQLHLPVIIHCREALDETLEVMQGKSGLRGVMHSFGGTPADVERIRRDHDFYFGINGVVTFKNCKVRESLPVIGTDRLLLETDSPYLAPVPHRGKRNESAYIIHTAFYVADCLDMSPEKLADITTANASALFFSGRQ